MARKTKKTSPPLPAKPVGVTESDVVPKLWLMAAVAAVLALLVFLPTLGAEFVDWDDTGVLTENMNYRGLRAEQISWMFQTNHYGHYQPITWLTYGLDYVIWGMNPLGYHLTNNLFHAANTLLVFWFSWLLLRRSLSDETFNDLAVGWVALVAALLFGLHPLRVESVAWATERRDLVSAFFLLLTLLAYVRSVDRPLKVRLTLLGVALLLYVLSMLSKVGGAPLPVILLVLDWYPLKRFGNTLQQWISRVPMLLVEKTPFFVIAIWFSVRTVDILTDRWFFPLDMHGYPARVAQAFYGLVFYLGHTLWPVNLLPLYELHTPLNPLGLRYVVSAVVVLIGAAAALYLVRRKCPGPLSAGLCYAFLLGPLLGFFQNGPQIVADRYSYLSCHGWILLIAGGGAWLCHRRWGVSWRTWFGSFSAAVVIVLSVLTVRQCGVWHDTKSLWEHVLEHDPGSSYAHNSYGYMISQEGDLQTAVDHYRTAIEIKRWNIEAWNNLWDALIRLDDQQAYVASLREGSQVDVATGQHIRGEAFYRLGNIHLRARENLQAQAAYRSSIQNRPDYPKAHVNLAIILSRLNQPEQAEQHARFAISQEPTLIQAWTALASALYRQGRISDALQAVDGALRLNPNHAKSLEWKQRWTQQLPER